VVPAFFIGTLDLGLVDIVPSALAAEDILDLFLLQILALVVTLGDDEVVGAGEAFKAILADIGLSGGVAGGHGGDAQHVAACRAEEQHWA